MEKDYVKNWIWAYRKHEERLVEIKKSILNLNTEAEELDKKTAEAKAVFAKEMDTKIMRVVYIDELYIISDVGDGVITVKNEFLDYKIA